MSSFLSFIGLIAIAFLILLVAIVLLSIKFSKDENGKKTISLFWGAIKISDNNVKVGSLVDVNGDEELVNVDNGKIIVDGKSNLIKVQKDLVVQTAEDYILINSNFNSKLLSAVLLFKRDGDNNIKVEGRKVEEDELYIHLQSKSKIDVKVQVDL